MRANTTEQTPDTAPRKCVAGTAYRRRWKKRFNSPEEIPDRNLKEQGIICYFCDNCGKYHLGHVRDES